MIQLVPFNATYIKIRCSDYGVEQELSEFFTFFAKDYKFLPAFKSGQWDGRIRLFNLRNKTLYKGLIKVLIKFCADRDYPLDIPASLDNEVGISRDEVQSFMKSLKLPHEIRDYQLTGVHYALNNKRSLLEAATSSGKSMMIYSAIRHHQKADRRVLLIVPNLNLVKQMFSDFQEYAVDTDWDVFQNVHTLYSGKERVFQAPVIISTWQTLLSMLKSDQQAFIELAGCTDVIIGDEAHQFKSTEVTRVMDAFESVEWRCGTTGTLDGIQLNILTLTGLFGPPLKVITARELIDQGFATPIEIRIMVLKHPEAIRKAFKGMTYTEEVAHIISNPKRNMFIAQLAKACTGNTLILYNYVARHGDLIHEKLKQIIPEGRNVYYIHGEVDVEIREQIRKIVEKENDAIILATSSLMSTGTNMPSIENLIQTMPGKSDTRLRQGAGRTLRLKSGKYIAKVFDIADDYRWKTWKNTAMKHLDERIKIYSQQEFPMKVINCDINY